MNTKLKRGIGALLSVAVIAGAFSAFPTNDVQAMELKRPERIRPTKETMWHPENVGGTLAGGGEIRSQSGYYPEHFSAFITQTNTVKMVGYGGRGQLGDGLSKSSLNFVDVLGENGVGLLTDVVQISLGQNHSLALKSDGTVWAWGSNGSGSLGNGTNVSKNTPVQVSEITDIIQVVAGQDYSLALKSDGTVWAWGSNGSGRLGDGTTVAKNTPVQVSGITDIVQITAGIDHSLALKSDGTVWAWGSNAGGKLGDGTTAFKNTPIQVSDITSIVQVVAGHGHSLALKSDGTVWAWGPNGYGELGIGIKVNQYTPTQVVHDESGSFLTDVVQISAGDRFSLALKSNGKVMSWGTNRNGFNSTIGGGQLGINTSKSESSSPIEIPDLTDIVSVVSSDVSSFSLKSDGTVQAWGINASGQLGNGTTINTSEPVNISFEGQKKTTIIPKHNLYKFTKFKEREMYEGGKSIPVNFESVSDKEIQAFDIYYAPYEGWDDKSTWVEIEKNVPVESLNKTPYTSDISNGQGGFFEGHKYEYNWNAPDEFLPHIRIITVPIYK